MKIRKTSDVSLNGVKVCVYGAAGSGKTTLCTTLPRPLILSAESGLLSIAGADLPYVEIESIDTLRECYQWLTQSNEANDFDSICLDSISEIAEKVLSSEKAASKDPRKAYGEMQDTMQQLVRSFRDLPGKHVYFSAKMEKQQDEMGRLLHSPSMPGNKLSQMLPYFFDEVLALRVERSTEGDPVRALMCDSDGIWAAKDRSGRLGMWEDPDLGAVIAKIQGGAQ